MRAVALLLTVTESLPSRVLMVSKFEMAVPSTVPVAEALMVRLFFRSYSAQQIPQHAHFF